MSRDATLLAGIRNLRTWRISLACALLACLAAEGRAQQLALTDEKEPGRHALVLWNRNYAHHAPLPSAERDAQEMATRLRDLRFTVREAEFTSVNALEAGVLPAFASQVLPGDIVLVYFSGHGFTYAGHNYIAPADLPQMVPSNRVSRHAIAVESVEDFITERLPGVAILLIDACRSMAGFIIPPVVPDRVAETPGPAPPAVPLGENLVAKGAAAHGESSWGANTLVGYAARVGGVAEGSGMEGTLSAYTAGILKHIHEPDEFGRVYDNIIVEVRIRTSYAQQPGMYDWSATDVYLNPSAALLADQKLAWEIAYRSGDYERILSYHERNAVTRHSAAARAWLAANQPELPRYTFLSPLAVERAWGAEGERRLIARPAVGFAYTREIRAASAESAWELQDGDLGLVRAGGGTPAATEAKLIRDLRTLEAHGTAVTIRPEDAFAAPSRYASVVSRLPEGTRLSVRGFENREEAGLWLVAAVGEGEPVYLRADRAVVARPPVDIGESLREVVAPPKLNSVRELVDAGVVEEALRALRAQGRRVFWVSLATAPTDDPQEADARAARVAHVEHVLQQAGIAKTQVTAVLGASGMQGDGVRVRFFGF